MTNRTKIIIGIVGVVGVIAAGIAVGNTIRNSKPTNSNITENKSIIDQYFENNLEENEIENNTINETLNDIEENTITENATTNTANTTNIANTEKNTNTSSNKIIGKEEQESQQENTANNDEETSIKLAKEEWGINVDAYIFKAEKKEDGIYEVKVINNDANLTEIARYTVNVKTGAVTE